MKEIKDALAVWREERNLSLNGDMNIYKGNIHEEIAEYYRANNDYERVDAICDIAVFIFNQFDVDIEELKESYDFDRDFRFVRYAEPDYLFEMVVFIEYYVYAISALKCHIESLGYDFEKCMMETIKEISSRKQCPIQKEAWAKSGAFGKWQKDKSQDKETLYKADYESCKKDK